MQLSSKPSLRTTALRSAMLHILTECESPLSVPEILQRLEQVPLTPNKTSVYREIDTLLASDLIEQHHLGADRVSYRSVQGGEHHHHLVCENCKASFCIDTADIEPVLAQKQLELAHSKQFTFLSHSLTFFGICNGCKQ